MCIFKAQQILPLNVQFHFNPLPYQKVAFTHVWYSRLYLSLQNRIDRLLISAGFFSRKHKYLAINLQYTYCFLPCGAELFFNILLKFVIFSNIATYQGVEKSLLIYKQFYFLMNTSSHSLACLVNALIPVATQIRAASLHFFTLTLPLKSCILKNTTSLTIQHTVFHMLTNRLCINSTITGSVSIFIGNWNYEWCLNISFTTAGDMKN